MSTHGQCLPLGSTVDFATSAYYTVPTSIAHCRHTRSGGGHQPAAAKPLCIPVGFTCVSLVLLPLDIALDYSSTTVLYELLGPETKVQLLRCPSYLCNYVPEILHY